MNESQIHQPHSAPWSWRSETPGGHGWCRIARIDDPNKYLMISADFHANEPSPLWHERTVQVGDGFRA